MDDLSNNVASNTRDLNSGRRKAFNVRINGEEHSSNSRNGIANIYFPIDGNLITISECCFKLIFNDGIVTGGSWSDSEVGTNMYPTLSSWEQRWPLGSEIDVDGFFGPQCVDYANAFWLAQTGRAVQVGASLNAYTMWTEKKTENMGTEFDAVENWSDLKPGDWAIWQSPTTGHVAMVYKIDNEGIHFWSQNYRNVSDMGSPLSEDIIPETSQFLKFLGAFRYKQYETS